MSNSHYERYILKAPAGIIFIAGGVFFLYYSITQLDTKDRWAIYGLISAGAITFGCYLLASAFINKLKSDMIKRQKARSGGTEKKEG